MKKIFVLVCLIIMTGCGQLYARDYVQYQKLFNRVDLAVKEKDLEKARRIIDTVDRDYKFVFSKHCMMALQICCCSNDSVRAVRWLMRCFLQGIPGWMIRQNSLAQKSVGYKNTQKVWQAYDSLRMVYKSSVDTTLAEQVEHLMQKDMRYTRKVNNGFLLFRHTVYGLQWMHNNSLVHHELKDIIEKKGFPGERLIGVPREIEDSAAFAKIIKSEGSAYLLNQNQALFMLLHYFSTPRDNINPLLYENILNGNLPVESYARISDYQYLFSKHRKRDPCFYVHSAPEEDIEVIDQRRAKIGLLSYGQQKQNIDLYWSRRKSGTMNAEIIYE